MIATLMAACGTPAPSPTAAPKAPEPTKPAAAPEPTKPAAAAPTTAPAVAPTTAPPAAPTAAAKPAAGAPKQVVRFTMFGHPNMIEEMVPKFNAMTNDVEVKFERSEGQGYYEKITAALAGGDAWDSFRLGIIWALRFGPKGVIADVGPMVNADTTWKKDQYVPGLLDTYTVDGKLYGVPGWTNCFFLYYNKKLFDQAGVPYPTSNMTWEQYVDMAKKMTKREGNTITQYGAAGFGRNATWLAVNAWNAGGCWYYKDDRSAICADDPLTIKVFQEEADLMNVHNVHPSPLNPPASPATLMSGKVATELNGDWLPWDQKDQWSPDFQVVLIPMRGSKRTTMFVSDALSINAKSKVMEGAYKWNAWFSASPDSWAVQGKVVFPTTKQLYDDPKLRQTWLTAPRPTTMLELAQDQVKTAKFWKVGVHAAEFDTTIFTPEADKVWRNKATAAEAMAIIQKKGDELLKKPIA